jgi:hypothetical protein
MPKAVSILFGALLAVSTAHALGRVLLSRLGAKLSRQEQPVYGFLAGAPLLSLLIFALASTRLVYDASFLILAAAAHAAAWRLQAFKPAQETLPPLPRFWRYLFWSVYAVFGAIAVIVAMSPEMSADGASYHLGVVQHYYRAHGFSRLATNMYANLSQGVELLFLMAWAFGRHSAAALTHCAFYLALPLAMLRFGQRHGCPAAAAAAALFAMCSPLTLVDGTSAYIDVAVAASLFAVFALCELEAPAVLLGLLAGACFGMKYTAFLAVPYAAARLALRKPRRDLLLFTAAAALMILPWVVRNAIWFQNPFSPLLNAWFPNQWIHVSFEQDYAEMMRRYVGLESATQIPWEITLRGRVLNGFLGPLFLLAPVALLALRWPLGRRLLAAGLVFALPYAANIGTRFLLPAVPFVALSMAVAFAAVHIRIGPWLLALLTLAHAVSSFPDMPSLYCDQYGWRAPKIPLRQALRLESEDGWLSRKYPPYRVAKMIEQATPQGARVFSFSPIPDSYTTREIAVGFQSALGERLRDNLQLPLIPDFQPVLSHTFTFAPRELSALRAVQTAAPAKGAAVRDVWSIAEFRIFDGDHELERSSDWLLTARPYPWDVQFAFDGSPLTRWRSWQWMKPGWYVEAAFERPRRASRVVLEMSSDQYAIRMKLQGRTPAGEWIELSPQPATRGLPPPLGLRRMATAELKRAGFHYFLVSEDDFQWQDYRDKAGMWGIREAASVDNYHLFHIQ